MPNGSITIYKLIILYTLSKVDSPLPPGVISDYITDRGYTNYFNIQNAIFLYDKFAIIRRILTV